MPYRQEINCGYLSRLVPSTRFLWIREDQTNVAAYGGLSFSGHPDMREPTTTIVSNKGERWLALANSRADDRSVDFLTRVG
jgi:hypothetical protein